MIARLRGRIWAATPDSLIVDVGGVGYRLAAPRRPGQPLPGLGEEITLFVHTHVREDALLLFGFQRAEELELFETLLNVDGVGPRLALAVLSALSPERFRQAVATGDAVTLTRVPGVGKKTAERLLFDLKERLGGPAGLPPGGAEPAWSGPAAEAQEALGELGYSAAEAQEAVGRALANGTAEGAGPADAAAIVRAALRYLSTVKAR